MSTVTADEYFQSIHRIISLLDTENIAIVRAMKNHGPRNLRNIAEKSGLPYPTVYARVNKLERDGVLRTWIHPDYSKINLAKAMVVVTPPGGDELLAREAVKTTGYWLRVTRCIGDCNGYYSLHAIPNTNRQDFTHFLDQLVARGLANSYRLFWLGETYSPIPNFDYYSVEEKTWSFDWKGWLNVLDTGKKARTSIPTGSDEEPFDKKDLIILKELVKSARTTLVDLSKLLSLTLPATKYRFDRLVREGFVYDNVINMLPYPPEMSDLIELKVDFKREELMKSYESRITTLPFVLSYSPVLDSNSASLRIYLPHAEIGHFLSFLSQLIKNDVITSYSYYLLDPMTIEAQTFSYEYYADNTGWSFQNREYLSTLDKLASIGQKGEIELPSLLPTAAAPML